MAFEIASTQSLYVRAIARYVKKCMGMGIGTNQSFLGKHYVNNFDVSQKSGDVLKGRNNKDEDALLTLERTKSFDSPSSSYTVASSSSLPVTADSNGMKRDTNNYVPPVVVNGECPTLIKDSNRDYHISELSDLVEITNENIIKPLNNMSLDDMNSSEHERGRVSSLPLTSPCLQEEEGGGGGGSAEIGKEFLREQELLRDFEISESLYGISWPTGYAADTVPLALSGSLGGSLYASPDFVTASIEMNRAIFNRHLTGEEKRKVLFGSDQIIP